MTTSLTLTDISLFKQDAYIAGQWATAQGGARFDVLNPANGQLLAQVPDMAEEEARAAIQAASDAWPAWRKLTAKARAAILRKFYDLLLAHQEDLAQIITAESGKPITEARGEVVYAASFFEWFAEEAKRVYGDVIPAPADGKKVVVQKQPVGVCAAITPWNFPIAMITRKLGAALAAGCPMVLKPAEDTPLTALALAELAERAGVPSGVFSVVTASHGAAVGGEFTANPLVRKVTFTGSTAVGKILLRQCADTVKKVSMELGGNAPFIVFDDADLDLAVAGAMASKYRNTGQTCVCANRILVQDGVYDAFAAKLKAAVEGLKVGDGADDTVTQGPLINGKGLAKVKEHVEDATSKGGTVITGGAPSALGHTFFEPTIITNMGPDMKMATEETFGPVAGLFRFETEDDAIRLANDTQFGLAAYFYSRDIGRVWRVSEALETGMVGINDGIISTEVAPFGGVKESGLGREGSKYGLDDYLEVKYLGFGGL